jgi:transcriptional regulator with XRE-family HTH domain
MIIGERLRALREEKNFSQGDIEKRTGLLRCYISRVENGHTVPAVETLEKFARALEVPTYQLFYEGDEPPKHPTCPSAKRRTKSRGGVPGRMRTYCLSFGDFWLACRKLTVNCCCTWPAKWHVEV